jgi:hypothetical protein
VQELLARPLLQRSIPKYVFRVTDLESHTIYDDGGFKAQMYGDTRNEDIPTFSDLISPISSSFVAIADMEMDVELHLTWKKKPTRWISTTTSLMAALQRMFIRHNRRFKPRLCVISTELCLESGIFVSTDLVRSLPGLLQKKQIPDSKLSKASPGEILVHGKIPSNAIVGFSTPSQLDCTSLDKIAPGLSAIRFWDDSYNHTLLGRNQWQVAYHRRFPLCRHATDDIVDEAVRLALLFGDIDHEVVRFLVEGICNYKFRIFPGSDDRGATIDKAITRVQDPISISELIGSMAELHLAIKSHSVVVERI